MGDGSWTKSFVEKINLLGDPAIYPTATPYICIIGKVLGTDSAASSALRAFRDQVLAPLPNGPEWIQRYYDASTAILRFLDP